MTRNQNGPASALGVVLTFLVVRSEDPWGLGFPREARQENEAGYATNFAYPVCATILENFPLAILSLGGLKKIDGLSASGRERRGNPFRREA